MKYVLCTCVLLAATSSFAQPQGQAPQTKPPYTTPPTFPETRQDPERHIPPDLESPPQKKSSTLQVERRIQQALNSESALSNTDVGVKADDSSVVLSGTVATEEQHRLAIRVAHSHAGDRKIVDKIKFREQT